LGQLYHFIGGGPVFPKDIYIDLGTENTRIYARKKGILLNEPTVIAHSSKTDTNTLGSAAKEMLGRCPSHLSVFKPLKEGVVKDFEHAKGMLSNFLKNAGNEMLLTKSRILISLPIEVDENEKELFRALAFELGAGIVHLVNEPLAGAIGTGANIFSKKPLMFLDLGAGTSEVIITSQGKIIRSEAVRVGGDTINRSIIETLETEQNFSVGEQTAEKIKKEVAVLEPGSTEVKFCAAAGVNLKTGFPETRMINSTMILSALLPTFNKITHLLTKNFNSSSAEIMSEVKTSGVMLFGGNSLVPGVTQFLFNKFGLPFLRSSSPLMSVTIGGSRILDDDQLFKDLKL